MNSNQSYEHLTVNPLNAGCGVMSESETTSASNWNLILGQQSRKARRALGKGHFQFGPFSALKGLNK